jgi:hypothetical protein
MSLHTVTKTNFLYVRVTFRDSLLKWTFTQY